MAVTKFNWKVYGIGMDKAISSYTCWEQGLPVILRQAGVSCLGNKTATLCITPVVEILVQHLSGLLYVDR